MRALLRRGYGPPGDVLEVGEIDPPRPGDNEVLVRVAAAGVNWADWSGVVGLPLIMRLGYGLRRPRNPVPGMDLAGTVEAVGRRVETLEPGDEVFGSGRGSFAELAVAKAKHLVHKPEALGFVDAAAVPMAGLVALQALRDVGEVAGGQHVLINGASGGIGTFAVQIAKHLGAEVTGVSSTPNLDLVSRLGADHVIDYTKEDFTEGATQYDFILDIADNRSLQDRRRVLSERGTLVPNSGVGGRWFGSVGRILGARLLSPFVRHKLAPFLSVTKQEDLAALRELIVTKEIAPVVGTTVSLDEAADAVAEVGAGHVRGKIVVVI